uniref:Protein NIM1-INTERACTING 1-like n=1 Tax=Nelumbo nucifera TaxID=4432 RepID=A0A822YLP3_NELNU|nr:TPA_asm: hypothetical protein HUJ06_011854 [Nelumbo nucifera]
MEKGGGRRLLVCDEQKDEEEEQKVDKFFALIKSFRDACDRRGMELSESSSSPSRKKRKVDEKEKKSVWVPKFEMEDFTEEIEFKSPHVIFPTPCYRKEKRKPDEEEVEGSLDLKLTL